MFLWELLILTYQLTSVSLQRDMVSVSCLRWLDREKHNIHPPHIYILIDDMAFPLLDSNVHLIVYFLRITTSCGVNQWLFWTSVVHRTLGHKGPGQAAVAFPAQGCTGECTCPLGRVKGSTGELPLPSWPLSVCDGPVLKPKGTPLGEVLSK